MIRLIASRCSFPLLFAPNVRWYHGHVKSFNNKKGFGFIHPEYELQNSIIDRYGTWKDVFVHYTDINDTVQFLIPSSKVHFDCILDENGPVAKNVEKIISKHKQMKIEKWLEAPPNIDRLVQQKEILPPDQWMKYMHKFYNNLSKTSPAKQIQYDSTQIDIKMEGTNREDYLSMINDLYSNFSDSTSKDNNNNK